MQSAQFSLTAVVNNYPSTSQTFIKRKLQGLEAAGVDLSIAATAFATEHGSFSFRPIPLAPWREPAHLIQKENRRALYSTIRAVVPRSPVGVTGSTFSKASIRERVISGPLSDIDTDVVHFEFSGIAVAYHKALGQLGRSKIAVSCRGTAEKSVPRTNPERIPLLQEVFHASDLIHCVSEDMRQTVLELGAPEDRLLVNRPAIPVSQFSDLAQRRTADRSHNRLRILSVGRLNWAKGFDDGLRTIKQMDLSTLEFRIAGEGPERAKLSFLIEELGLTKATQLLGSCTQDQIRQQLAWADVLFVPSLSEGISNAALEAMASGIPVVSTRCGGMPEVINDEEDGLLVPPGDIEALAAQLARLRDDQDLRNRLGAAAMERARREFDISRQVSTFIDAYQRIIAK